MGTEEGIEALAEFLRTSGAFRKGGNVAAETEEPRIEDEEGIGRNMEELLGEEEEEDGRIAVQASDDED